jgi:monoterpene epsilon-lactone hydrolase
MSQQQRDALDELLRSGPLDLGGNVEEQRVIFEEMMGAIPVPADVAASPGTLGGIPVVNVDVDGADPGQVILYFHGGAYAVGTAASSVGLASDLARRAGARLVSVDYGSRLSTPTPPPSRTPWPPIAVSLPADSHRRRSPSPESPPGPDS